MVLCFSGVILQFRMAHLITLLLTTNPDCLQKASGLKMPKQEANCGVGSVLEGGTLCNGL